MNTGTGSPVGNLEFPPHNIPDSEKDTDWMLRWARAIYSYWWASPWGGCLAPEAIDGSSYPAYRHTRLHYQTMRQYASGTQPSAKYRRKYTLPKGDGDRSGDGMATANLDWTVAAVLGKYADIMASLIEENAAPMAVNAMDPTSQDSEQRFRMRRTFEIMKAGFLRDAYAAAGLHGEGDPTQPQTIDELNMYMAAGMFKPAACMALEGLIEASFNLNRFNDEIRAECLRLDLIPCGIAAVSSYVDASGMVKSVRVPPEDLVLPRSVKSTFSDAPWIACIEWMTVPEIIKQSKGEIPEEGIMELERIARHYGSGRILNPPGGSFAANIAIAATRQEVPVLCYYVKTNNKLAYKSKTDNNGNLRMDPVDEGYSPRSERNSVEKAEYLCVYQGRWVVNTKWHWGTGKMPHQPMLALEGAEFPLRVICPDNNDMSWRSFIDRVIPYADQYQLAWLKYQLVAAEIGPPMIAVKADWLVSSIGDGNYLRGAEMWKVAVANGLAALEDPNPEYGTFGGGALPIQEIKRDYTTALNAAINAMTFALMRIEGEMGFNDSTNATSGDPDQLVGQMQMQMAGTSRSIGRYDRAYDRLAEMVARDHVCAGMQSIRAGTNDAGWSRMVGDADLYVLKELSADPFTLGMLGVAAEHRLGREDRQMILETAKNASDRREAQGFGGITFEDFVAISTMRSLNKMRWYLAMSLRLRKAEDAQAQAAAAQQQEEAAAAADQRRLETEMQVMEAKKRMDDESKEFMNQLKTELSLTLEGFKRESRAIDDARRFPHENRMLDTEIDGEVRVERVAAEEQRRTQKEAPRPTPA